MTIKPAKTWTVEVRGWLSQDVAEQFAAAISKSIPLPGLTVAVVKHGSDRA